MAGAGATYLGGLSWAPEPGWGELTGDAEKIELRNRNATILRTTFTPIVSIQVRAIDCIEVTSEQVAKRKVGAVLLFGVWGGLAAKGSEDRGAFLVHTKGGETGYFTIAEYSQHQILAKIAPWLQSLNIRVGAPDGSDVREAGPALPTLSVADEIAKLGELKAVGLLTEEEFATQKAKLLG